jgi:hypothetical protein
VDPAERDLLDDAHDGRVRTLSNWSEFSANYLMPAPWLVAGFCQAPRRTPGRRCKLDKRQVQEFA